MIKVSVVETGLLLCAVRLLDSVHNSCHIISLCVFSSSPESIILSLPSRCQPFHLCHTHSDIPVCFFIASLSCAAPSSPVGHWSFMLSLCSVFSSSKHLHLSSNPCLLLFFSSLVLKVVISLFCNLILFPPTDLSGENNPFPAKYRTHVSIRAIFCSIRSRR